MRPDRRRIIVNIFRRHCERKDACHERCWANCTWVDRSCVGRSWVDYAGHSPVALALPAMVAASCWPRRPGGQEDRDRSKAFTEYRLDNGLQVLLYPDDSKPTVTVNLTVFVGSRQEGYGETGMAHLLEHMLFKGTPTHPQDSQGAARTAVPITTAPPGSTARTTTRRCRPRDDNLDSPWSWKPTG